MARSFADDCGFNVEDRSIWIQYADGSYAETNGVVVAEVAVGFEKPIYKSSEESTVAILSINPGLINQYTTPVHTPVVATAANRVVDNDVRRVVTVDFHLKDDLITEVHIGEDAVAVLQPHRLNVNNFTWSADGRSRYPYINRITEVQRPSKIRRLATAMGFGDFLFYCCPTSNLQQPQQTTSYRGEPLPQYQQTQSINSNNKNNGAFSPQRHGIYLGDGGMIPGMIAWVAMGNGGAAGDGMGGNGAVERVVLAGAAEQAAQECRAVAREGKKARVSQWFGRRGFWRLREIDEMILLFASYRR
ncbi:hypothetical protein EJ08DRAFT_725175 [Tothia fuscella]|uniref:Uncharacterized protein n=1 Tax=Tothia fuscella TaxID=1048955 RepID=A0A9P4NIH6_9PEZI|nr:hypothetical protein EJ08DRAFT_725175 [Tothia fuscella]